MENNLKLFVFSNCLYDWTGGVAFAIADSVEHAKSILCSKYFTKNICNGTGKLKNEEVWKGQLDDPTTIITEYELTDPKGFWIYGGG